MAEVKGNEDNQSQEWDPVSGTSTHQTQRQRHRSFQRMNSIKRQDSWTDFKDRAFKVATAVCLPKHKRVTLVQFAGGSMKTSAPSQSVKSLPQLKPCDTLKLRKNFRRSISAQEPSRIHDPPQRLFKERSPRKVLFAPEEPCIDEERERSISESSSAPSVLEKDEGDIRTIMRSKRVAPPIPEYRQVRIAVEEDEDTSTSEPFLGVLVEDDKEVGTPSTPTGHTPIPIMSMMRRDFPPPFIRQKSKEARSEDEEPMEGQLEKEEFSDSEDDMEDKEILYSDFYTCIPPPVFMTAITIIQVSIFIYHAKILKSDPKYGYIGKYSPAPLDSKLIYSPLYRLELWRWMTYALVHSGYMHLINNIVVQLVLGILLEMVHKFWRVLAIYFAGILAGSLATSIVEPFNYLAGASAGVYALITAHLSTGVWFMA